MNSPVMQGLTLNTPSYVKNARLIAWVAAGAMAATRSTRGSATSWWPPAR